MIKRYNTRGLVLNFDNSPQEGLPIQPIDYAKIKVGSKTLNNAVLAFGDLHNINPRYANKCEVLRAMHYRNYEDMRAISEFFYNTSGIYSRLCRYMAYLYRYDWLITPYVGSETIKKEKIMEGFNKSLNFMDNFQVKRFLEDVSLKVVKYGVYYGYKIWTADKVIIQELPPKYCRTRFFQNGESVVEFHMAFFDEVYRSIDQRMKILKAFPKEFQRGYVLYKQGKLPPAFQGDTKGWFTLDPEFAFKFNLNGQDFPAFISVIPHLIDLDNAQGIDRKKMEQQILKILIQKMPIDKNGDLIFDPDEAAELHRNAVAMMAKTIGLEVLTTYADVDVEDMAEDVSSTTDELEKVERTVYNEAGVSQIQFNTDGNIALEKSILNDEATMRNLLLQFESFLNSLLKPFNKSPKKIMYKLQLLSTTIYNYKDMAKAYKELTQLGYSKMLPAIALGESQSSILANAYFENDILELWNVFIPPISSNVMNGDMLTQRASASKSGNSNSEDGAGRPEKDDSEKSEKTIQNKESMS